MSVSPHQNHHQQQKEDELMKENLVKDDSTEVETNDQRVTFLVLGDGDFSYSLDLCRFLDAFLATKYPTKKSDCSVATIPDSFTEESMEVRVTGIDSIDELKLKYRDIDSILRKIRALDCSKKNCRNENNSKKRKRCEESHGKLSISVHHDINAIQPWHKLLKNDSPSFDFPVNKHNHVIFNHPHLGKEDATLHARFISHLFHSARNHWLRKGGVIHITLILGQCERWKCLDSAKFHNMCLLHRGLFRPPPSPGLVYKTRGTIGQGKKCDFHLHYHERRHQNGRSFANRTNGGSETLTFGRMEDAEFHTPRSIQLPWTTAEFETYGKENANFTCSVCHKSFREKRSLKNHMKSVHDNVNNNTPHGRCDSIQEKQFPCELCGQLQRQKVFSTLQALEDHKRSKHFLYKDIKPEWASTMKVKKCMNDDNKNIEIQNISNECQIASLGVIEDGCKENKKCQICEFVYTSNCSEEQHYNDFTPPRNVSEVTNDKIFQCSLCSKMFANQRALMQHSNFCYQHKDESEL